MDFSLAHKFSSERLYSFWTQNIYKLGAACCPCLTSSWSTGETQKQQIRFSWIIVSFPDLGQKENVLYE